MRYWRRARSKGICLAFRCVATDEKRPETALRLDTFRRNRTAKRLLVWLLVALLPLQATVACALAMRGPLHTHRAESRPLVLEDFRRAPVPVSATPVHIATAFGHFHAGARRFVTITGSMTPA